jgi:C4-dicarboxylate-specific signal transduction histidine kinase
VPKEPAAWLTDMNFENVMTMAAGVTQFAVACYALRLNRLFGAPRVGWSLFAAFAAMALLRLFLSLDLFRGMIEGGRAEIVYVLTSILLLTGMVHLESLLKERRRVEQAEQKAQVKLESQVRQQTAELIRANEELQEKAATLKAEIARREKAQAEKEKTHEELIKVSRAAGMSEVATGVLHNVGNVLNSINISASIVAEHLNEFNIANIARAADLMRDHADDIGNFMANDPKGRQLPDYLAQLSSHLSAEQSLLLKEISFVKMKIEHVKEIVAAQQNYGKVMGLEEPVKIEDLIRDVFRIHATELAQHEVQVRQDFPPGLPKILMDKHKVLQILLNLLSNAKHAVVDSGRKDKQVIVRVSNGDNRLRIAMTDNGVGISPVNLRKIFNHGFTTRKKDGHGFGLHSGALAAKEMGGALHAQSDGPGEGATFTLEIPFKPAENTQI